MIADDEWTLIEGVLEECWPGEWTERTGPAYRLMLGDYSAVAIVEALRAWARSAKAWRPSVSEIIRALEHDPGKPAWGEVFDAIFGRGGILQVRGPRRYSSQAEKDRMIDEAIQKKAEDYHPFIQAFVASETPYRLRMLDVWDEERGRGAWRQKELKERWEAFVEVAEERQARGLPMATGGKVRGLGRMQPLAALGVAPPQLTALEGGAEAAAS